MIVAYILSNLKNLNSFFSKLFIACVYLFFSLLLPSNAATAQVECTEESLRNRGVAIINCKGDTAVCGSGPTSTSSIKPGSSIYVLGDSILNSAKEIVSTKLTEEGFVVAGINADGGRAISYDSNGSQPSGIDSVIADAAIISESDAVVIQLGTNSGRENLDEQIPVLISEIRKTGFSGLIFWMNLFYTANDGPSSNNSIITTQASLQNYTVIDTSGAEIELQSDGIHPTADGSLTFSNTLVNGLLAAVGSAPVASGVYDPISLTFPNFPDVNAVSSSITAYLQENKPNTPWLGISANFGEWLVQETKTRNINPLLIMSIGKQENQFGTTREAHVRTYHNYFGMKGDSPINIPGDYRGFSSPEEGMTFFLDKVKENTQGPDKGYYTEVVNFYDYLGMHQAGQIKYPGEPLGNQGPTGQDGYDPSMDVYISWTTTDHPNNIHDGTPFNPGVYFTNSINFINELLGTNLSTIPVRGPTSAGSGADCGSDGAVSANGYAFPLAPQTKRGYSAALPCNEASCHHDGTPAFDLSYPGVEGQSVYAIIGGTIKTIGEQDPGFCQSIQLAGSDGFYYWYGHLIDVIVEKGQAVQVGQELAKVATWSEQHDCDGTSSGPHLHIDRGCTLGNKPQDGGSKACRDPAFIPLMNAIYESLPANKEVL